MKLRFLIPAAIALLTGASAVAAPQSGPDPDFHIYLAIGQSNMAGGARPAEQGSVPADSRYRVMAATDDSRGGHNTGQWYPGREDGRLGLADFFAHTMVANLPANIRVGVINVSVAGSKIELWGKETYEEYLAGERDWLIRIAEGFGSNPYGRLVDLARAAQRDGVIKGLIVHQGESNSTDPEWCNKIKGIYEDLVGDLGLDPAEFHLLAGELKSAEEGGVCASFNSEILLHLPSVVPGARIVSSAGCKGVDDEFHFSLEGFREFGKRYAVEMLRAQGLPYHRIALHPGHLGIGISPTLNGIFYEDINQANDGGISAQLIQNNSFQMYNVPGAPEKEFSLSPDRIFGWTTVSRGAARGTATTVDDQPLVRHKTYYDFDPADEYDDGLKYKQYSVRIDIADPGEGFGIAANGFGIAPYGPEREGFYYSNDTQIPSIAVEAGVGYDLGLWLQGARYRGSVEVWLEDASGAVNSEVLSFGKLGRRWTKFTGRLTAQRSVDSRLVIAGDAAGTFHLDFVTLTPEPSRLWKGGAAGALRADLLGALDDLNPGFMRFPGGCASEGPDYWGQVFWKNTIGPVEERIGVRNHWGYWTSQYVGFYEYLCMAEALGAKPLPVLNNGVTCQFAGHAYIAPLETEADRKRFYDIYVKDALDFIEFCNGGVDTEWGAVRAAHGHPASFNLEYLAIGNENQGEEFWERLDIICRAVNERYPEIKMITTSGARAAGREFDTNYAIIDAKYPDTIVDEHYYQNDEWFFGHTHRYDADQLRGGEGITYDRERSTRVFVGEFANSRTNNAFASTLAEAAFFTGLERNSDMVVMAAYAPLLCKKGFNKWNSNLVWFDNRGLWRTTNYFYMSMFANNTGDRAFETSQFSAGAPGVSGAAVDSLVYISATVDTRGGTLYVKAVNAEAREKITEVTVDGGGRYRATLEYLSSEDTSIKNQGDQNYYAGAPGGSAVSYDEPVVPRTLDLGVVSGRFIVTLPLNSVNVIKLTPIP